MSDSESQNMMDNVVAMTDLTDDENSPRHQMSMDERETEIFQAFQAYQVGLDLVSRIRNAEDRQNESANADGTTTNAEMNSESSGSENLPEQLRRYLHIPLEEASDPELWMEIHHGGDENESENETWDKGDLLWANTIPQRCSQSLLWANTIPQRQKLQRSAMG